MALLVTLLSVYVPRMAGGLRSWAASSSDQAWHVCQKDALSPDCPAHSPSHHSGSCLVKRACWLLSTAQAISNATVTSHCAPGGSTASQGFHKGLPPVPCPQGHLPLQPPRPGAAGGRGGLVLSSTESKQDGLKKVRSKSPHLAFD